MNANLKRTIASVLAAIAVCSAGSGSGATLAIQVGADGRPLPDAVVTAVPVSSAQARAPRIRPNAVMVQQFQQFSPFVMVVQAGTTVEFPNRDPFRHHVYSFSPAKSFELKLYGNDKSEAVVFDKEGVVALGCNIHDNMLAYIYVVATPYFAKTGPDGIGTIADMPAGTYTITLWHPDQKGEPAVAEEITLAADQKREINVNATLKRERRQRLAPPVDENAY